MWFCAHELDVETSFEKWLSLLIPPAVFAMIYRWTRRQALWCGTAVLSQSDSGITLLHTVEKDTLDTTNTHYYVELISNVYARNKCVLLQRNKKKLTLYLNKTFFINICLNKIIEIIDIKKKCFITTYRYFKKYYYLTNANKTNKINVAKLILFWYIVIILRLFQCRM